MTAPTTPKTRRTKRATPTLGIHIDGPNSYATLLKNGEVTKTLQGKGPTPAEQINYLLNETQNPQRVRIIYPTPHDTATPFTATPAHTNYTQLQHTAQTLLPPNSQPQTYAAHFHPDHPKHATTPAFLAATNKQPITTLYNQLRNPHIQITHEALTSHHLNGATLAIYHNHTTLTYTKNNTIYAHQTLPTPGLAHLNQQLGLNSQANPRLAALLTLRTHEQQTTDPQGAEELQRYLRRLINAVHTTLQTWHRQGHNPPNTIYCHGPGAAADQLNPLLNQYHLTPTTKDPTATHLNRLPLNQRPTYVYAYLAAATYSQHQPHTSYPNPQLTKHLPTAQLKRHRTRRKYDILTAATLTGLIATAPAVAAIENHHEKQRYQTETETYAKTLNIPTQLIQNPAPNPQTLTKLTTIKTATFTQMTTLPGAVQLTYQTPKPSPAITEIATHLNLTHTTYNPTTQTLTVTGTPISHAENQNNRTNKN